MPVRPDRPSVWKLRDQCLMGRQRIGEKGWKMFSSENVMVLWRDLQKQQPESTRRTAHTTDRTPLQDRHATVCVALARHEDSCGTLTRRFGKPPTLANNELEQALIEGWILWT